MKQEELTKQAAETKMREEEKIAAQEASEQVMQQIIFEEDESEYWAMNSSPQKQD